jgi:hypothetical protein
MPDAATATASVATDTPERYAKQLASHLGRKAEVHDEADGIRIVLTRGSCLVQPREGALELSAEALDEESLDLVTDVIGRHLERFGQRNELAVHWRRQSPNA